MIRTGGVHVCDIKQEVKLIHAEVEVGKIGCTVGAHGCALYLALQLIPKCDIHVIKQEA